MEFKSNKSNASPFFFFFVILRFLALFLEKQTIFFTLPCFCSRVVLTWVFHFLLSLQDTPQFLYFFFFGIIRLEYFVRFRV